MRTAYVPHPTRGRVVCARTRALASSSPRSWVARGAYPINALVACTPAVADCMLAEFRVYCGYGYIDGDAEMFAPLTAHEIAILDCIARGMTNSEIAATLVTTNVTV